MLAACDLEEKGKLATKLRAQIDEKAKHMHGNDEIPIDNHKQNNRRQGMKYSTAANNPEGLQEKEIKAQHL